MNYLDPWEHYATSLKYAQAKAAKKLQIAMKYDKHHYEQFKSAGDPSLGSIPAFVIVSGGGSRVSGSADCADLDKFIELSRERRYYNDAA